MAVLVASLVASWVFAFCVVIPVVGLVGSRILYPRRKRRLYGGEVRFSVNVVVPCQGFQVDLEDNLRAIADQDYCRYIVTFVTDTASDPSVAVIRRLRADRPWVRHVVAGFTDSLCSQQNHVEAVAMTGDTDSDIFVKCDSDMRPPRGWLHEFVRPFQDPEVAATTSRHWISPHRPGFVNGCYTGYNGFATTLMGWPSVTSIWGGCFGIRREVFLALDVPAMWRATGTDDSTLRNLLVSAGMKTEFVPDAVAPAYESPEDLAVFVRWLARQFFHARIYLAGSWVSTLVIETVGCLGFVAALAVLAYELAASRFDAIGIAAAAILASMLACGPLVKLFRPNQRDIPLLWWAPLGAVGHLLGCAAVWRSALMRTLPWRGYLYEFNPDGTVRSKVRQPDPPAGADPASSPSGLGG